MERDILRGVAFWVGAVAIVAIYNVITYRVGKFPLMPGERRRLAVNGLVFLALAAVLGIVLPIGTRLLGQSPALILGVVSIGLLAFGMLYGRRRRERLAEILQSKPPEVQTEYARRKAFIRSRRGWWLSAAMFLAIFVWAFVTSLIGR